jgi:small subunit ribosomal protein S8
MKENFADIFTRIRNAQQAGHMNVSMPSSKIKKSVAAVLEAEGYISGFAVDSEVKPTMTIDLKYYEGKPVIERIQRVSRPGLRQYRGSADLPKVEAGLGVAIVSTSKGVMTDRAARAAGVGGEVIATVF